MGRVEESMETTFEIAITFEPLTCCVNGCGMTFAVPVWFVERRRGDHEWWYCPNGHRQYFVSESDSEKLRRELASANGNLKYTRERLETEKRSTAAQKGQKTRILNRVKAGICPFCSRRFDSLGLHVQAEHGDEVAAETGDKS